MMNLMSLARIAFGIVAMAATFRTPLFWIALMLTLQEMKIWIRIRR